MPKKLIFTNKAESDIAEAYRWYENRQIGLGSDLIKSIDTALSQISQSPLQYQAIIDKNIRRALTNRFPYSIYFIDEIDTIRILAILHQRQKYPDSTFDNPINLN